eukprot:TRINITY_DN485_c0_g1::TRINITY_DN485_c0_g1_i1::g.2524::m.2524 TRINITY_DN485_c0_g1::TRINITY_DN485_c0_g1_i1::g.2524  ORF type:complete len:666 (+),score=163.84,sp/Q9M2V7/AB16G_ARATH/37.37/5e-137,ABC2_membrane/PF01061.19/2.1e-38,ABC2_membrane/PF01061.19/6.2e+02,ABC_tran/PF00005.22/1.5e-25,AAA_21/PF13304.1/0.0049,AAA_21/PF13304.1/0.68,AAA_25/PF13481.1/0.0012,AAA_25/PF13481.1/3.4,AAA_16/PF13191.1/2.4e-05,AAA_29/PF13555.1/0.00037,DUF258/PF03193.11/0.00057,SMC_N/PF02463.14/0.41,SMC_N/PF02463.14/2.1,AAA_2
MARSAFGAANHVGYDSPGADAEMFEKFYVERRAGRVELRSVGIMCDIYAETKDQGNGIKIPTRLDFENLTYRVYVKDEVGNEIEKVLLDNVTGHALPSEVLAIVGPSGAGKSTLLDCLAGRISQSSIEGNLKLNGRPLVQQLFRRQSGYVLQSDDLFPLLTVKETLVYSALLRTAFTPEQIELRIMQLLKELNISKITDSVIGDTHEGGVRGISGGERRRVSIAVDMVHDPMVLFLDEPSSGLDSTSALSVVSALNTMAEESGRTVILTIHQPSTRIMDMLHKVLVLVNGHVAYLGPFSGLQDHFRPLAPEASHVRMDPLEYALDACEYHAKQGDVKVLTQRWQETVKGRAKAERQSRHGRDDENVMQLEQLHLINHPIYTNAPVEEIKILFGRAFTNTIRTKELFLARTGLTCVIGFSVATVFYNLGHSYMDIQDRLSFYVYTIMALSYTMVDALPIFLNERSIFIRETSRGAYRPSSYTLAYSLVFIPFLLVQALMFVVVTWWMVGFAGGVEGFVYYVMIMWAAFMNANALVMFISAVTPDFMVGNTLYGALIPLMFLFSGFFIPRDDIPGYWLPLHYVSVIKYPWEGCVINEFDRDSAVFACPVYDGIEIAGCDVSGQDILEYYGVENDSKWGRFFIVVAFSLLYRFLFFLAMHKRSQATRK